MLNHEYTSLNNGVKVPWVGLGVWTAERQDATDAVKFALRNGYRSIDTAAAYLNEGQVGKAIQESGVNREDLFIATKVANGDQGYESTLRAFDKSLETLHLDYLDLYLIHWPVKGKSLETWKALEHLYKEKKVRAIGVSNFQISDLEELWPVAEIKPMINQIEFHPYLTQKELSDYCKKQQIHMEAWSPLMKGLLSEHPILLEIARHHQKTVAQVILRWDIQNRYVTIPKSFNEKRILENLIVFDFMLSQEEMERISILNRNEKLPMPDMSKFREHDRT
ncbi:aldo/keto reductase [Paenibacillus kribbensis]|uniref:aldo/keto reductase n=1 Tax=Paenibacillus kribbensis TaxID=172713 RepID=UPI002DB9D583|nr:aldo/keto reductase [Paenibacillus kribbensis]MEC0236242.1 aldo/keto reductase [Paenibacillus kribbensis]